jgi:hypothetical protein
MIVGFVAIARPTFDIAFARALAEAALEAVKTAGIDVLGSSEPALTDADVDSRADAWSGQPIDGLIVLQASFADSTLAGAAAATTGAPVILWGAPEPRTGHRLRRNSLCGINLAAFRLANSDRDYRYVYADPSDRDVGALLRDAVGNPLKRRTPEDMPTSATAASDRILEQLSSARIGVIGRRPDGFEPCGYDPEKTLEVTGAVVEQIALDELFDVASVIDDAEVDGVAEELRGRMDLGDLTPESIEPSLRLHAGIREICSEKEWSAVATRCWPECFTEFGGAACTAQGLLTSRGIPAQCEADAYGAITSLLLQWATGSVAFTADLVDIDFASDTAVVWHCGLAPFEMAAPDATPRGTLHSNRGMPLVSEFALAPGNVTIARLSQSRGQIRMVVGSGEMLDTPRPFSGTAGTLRFHRSARDVLHTVMSEGLEHHYGIAYGDATGELRSVAAGFGVDVVEL